MTGNHRQRFCAQCNKSVYNFSAMTALEVEKLVARSAGRLCARFYQRADGTMLTQDCPVGFRTKVRRVSRVAGAALSAAMGLSFAAAQNAPQTPSLVQIESAEEGVDVDVVDPTGAVIPNASVRLMFASQKLDALADRTGRAHFPNRPEGRYELLVRVTGFKTTRVLIEDQRSNVRVIVQVGSPAVMGGVWSGVPLQTTPTVLDDQLPLPVTPPTTSVAPPRNPVSRFFSTVGHKLGF